MACSVALWALQEEPCCGWIDFEEDGDVDLMDVAELQRRFGATHALTEWQLLHTYQFADPIAAHFNPMDGSNFVGRFSGDMGLYRIDSNGGVDAVWTGDHITGLVVDVGDGDVLCPLNEPHLRAGVAIWHAVGHEQGN